MARSNNTATVVTTVADTTVLPFSTNTRANLLRQQAEREAAKAAERRAVIAAAAATNYQKPTGSAEQKAAGHKARVDYYNARLAVARGLKIPGLSAKGLTKHSAPTISDKWLKLIDAEIAAFQSAAVTDRAVVNAVLGC
jgi:hypothetical protein